LMPLGVEHGYNVQVHPQYGIPKPLMPLGVEHKSGASAISPLLYS